MITPSSSGHLTSISEFIVFQYLTYSLSICFFLLTAKVMNDYLKICNITEIQNKEWSIPLILLSGITPVNSLVGLTPIQTVYVPFPAFPFSWQSWKIICPHTASVASSQCNSTGFQGLVRVLRRICKVFSIVFGI